MAEYDEATYGDRRHGGYGLEAGDVADLELLRSVLREARPGPGT